MSASRLSRRRFLTLAGGVAGAVTLPRPLHAQPKTIKVGVVSPISGAMAEVGGDCRLGAQLAAEAINAAGARSRAWCGRGSLPRRSSCSRGPSGSPT